MVHIPGSTYRLQFNRLFRFEDARTILPYLSALGITDVYASPVFAAVEGSMHGYDIVDPNTINPEIGSEDDFDALINDLRELGMYWLQDIVPNHMAYSSQNRMLMDLLENGTDSRFAGFFDVGWNHPHASVRQRILAPFLGTYYWDAITGGVVRLAYGEEGFTITFYDSTYPVRIESYAEILSYLLDRLKHRLGRNNPDVIKYQGILYAIKSLPPELSGEERSDQIRFIKEILWELYSQNQEIKDFIDETVKIYNAERELTESHDLMNELLNSQHYRLSYWKVANEEINYRRFFTISGLIGVRMENEEAFNRMHSLLVRLVKDGSIDGLRIDHVDGLFDPAGYLTRLYDRTKLYIVVEKILEAGEKLPREWPVEGTTGYDFTGKLTGLFCRREHGSRFDEIYTSFTGRTEDFHDIVTEKKRLMVKTRMAGEVERLAFLMEGVSSRDRYGIDITMLALKQALEEILIHFPVYRTYVNGEDISEQDRAVFTRAIEDAKRANPRFANELSYIGNILTGLREKADPELKARFIDFIMRLQQLTGPVMAKGFEDTALYIYNRLISLNEVGGDPQEFGTLIEEFHDFNRERAETWPHTFNTTCTHDTKRGEDVRARINVLSELPDEWEGFIAEMRGVTEQYRSGSRRHRIPDRNDEYFFYQTLLGSYPFPEDELPEYLNRLKGVIIKGVREAAVHTAWIRPDEEYENGYLSFIEKTLAPDNAGVRRILDPFRRKIAFFGVFNSLSQTLLKAAAPGVPDFYRGGELWDFSLVDPDNRRPVDFELRRKYLEEILSAEEREPPTALASYARELLEHYEDGRVKLFLTRRLLRARNLLPEVFSTGSYTPLPAGGRYGWCVTAFARENEDDVVVAAAPRFLTSVTDEGTFPAGEEIWLDTTVRVPSGVERWKNLVTGEELGAGESFPAGRLFESFPAALLAGSRTATKQG